MTQRRTIFRLFTVLVLFVLGNLAFFRSYFHNSSDRFWTSTTFIGFDISYRIWGNSTPSNATLGENRTSSLGPTTTTVVVAGQNTSARRNSTAAESTWQTSAPEPTKRVFKAYGEIVTPLANISAPWEMRNISTLCPLVPPLLVGPLKMLDKASSLAEVVRLNPGLEPGGHYQPSFCKARHRVAIIVPYRDRESHLQVMLHNLHPMLIRQQLDYFVLVVELAKPTTFNRGMLLNIGAVEAQGLWDVQCFIFHDVDLVPENDRNLYTCPEHPRHMSAAVDKFGYKLPYQNIFGGVSALSVENLYKVNGYSNAYFGWGGEDDDIRRRLGVAGLKMTRYAMDIGRYHMIRHPRDKNNAPNPKRFKMLKSFKHRQATDGLNSLEYQVEKVEFRPAYTWILVTVDKQEILETLESRDR